MKNILFYNKKGGQGKTTLATNYARFVNGNYITNDENNFTEEVFKIETTMIRNNQPIEDVEINDDAPNIFDFGGYSDSRVLTVAQFVDTCVVPIYYQAEIDLKSAIETMATLKRENENVAFVINNTEKQYLGELSSYLEKIAKTFIIPKSEYLKINDKGLYQQYEEGHALQKHIIKKNVLPYFNQLFNYLQGA